LIRHNDEVRFDWFAKCTNTSRINDYCHHGALSPSMQIEILLFQRSGKAESSCARLTEQCAQVFGILLAIFHFQTPIVCCITRHRRITVQGQCTGKIGTLTL